MKLSGIQELLVKLKPLIILIKRNEKFNKKLKKLGICPIKD